MFTSSILRSFGELPNGFRSWTVGGRGLCLGARKTRSQKNACTKCGDESHLPKRSEGVYALLGVFFFFRYTFFGTHFYNLI